MGTYFTGIYTTSFYIAVIIEIPRRIVTQISTPLIARNLASNNVHGIFDIYSKSSLNLMIVGMLILIGLWANLDNIYHFIPNKAIYETGKWIVIIIGTGKLIDMSFGLNGEIIILSKYYKINILLTGFLAIITITLNVLLIPVYGLNGAAMGNAFSLILFNILKYFFVWNKFKMQPFTGKHFLLFVIGTVILLPSLIIPSLNNRLADILIRSTLITVLFIASIYYSKISKEVNETIEGVINKFIK
jgi:O-antigen/teichoic acid export membrane protein